MAAHGAAASELQRVSGFIQNQPSDGKPATEPTDAYLGYDQRNLYIVMVCWQKNGVRADLTRREPATPFDSDDYVEITLDTFQDERHAFVFDVNPKGVQADGLWTEGQGQPDYCWGHLMVFASPRHQRRLRGLDCGSFSQPSLSLERRALGSDALPLSRPQQ
jgi:hypothetical protein